MKNKAELPQSIMLTSTMLVLAFSEEKQFAVFMLIVFETAALLYPKKTHAARKSDAISAAGKGEEKQFGVLLAFPYFCPCSHYTSCYTPIAAGQSAEMTAIGANEAGLSNPRLRLLRRLTDLL
jgi:hypothetical protein